MKLYYSLLNVPNQSFTTALNRNSIRFVFHTFHNTVFVDAYVNNTLYCAGVVAVPNKPLFSNAFNKAINGIMKFETIVDEDITYTSFNNTTCRFVYQGY